MSGPNISTTTLDRHPAKLEEKLVAEHNELPDINARLENPLTGISPERLMEMGRSFAQESGLSYDEEIFAKGALIAQDPSAFESLPLLTDEDKTVLRRELTHKWDHPKELVC